MLSSTLPRTHRPHPSIYSNSCREAREGQLNSFCPTSEADLLQQAGRLTSTGLLRGVSSPPTPGASSSRSACTGPAAGDRSSAHGRMHTHVGLPSPESTSHRLSPGESAEQVGRAMATDKAMGHATCTRGSRLIRGARKHTPGCPTRNPLILATQHTRYPHAPTLPRNSLPKPSGTQSI